MFCNLFYLKFLMSVVCESPQSNSKLSQVADVAVSTRVPGQAGLACLAGLAFLASMASLDNLTSLAVCLVWLVLKGQAGLDGPVG
jgi:hypothetical protein